MVPQNEGPDLLVKACANRFSQSRVNITCKVAGVDVEEFIRLSSQVDQVSRDRCKPILNFTSLCVDERYFIAYSITLT